MQGGFAVRLALLLAWMPLLAPGQEPGKPAPAVPADRRADTYAVYSAVLAHPRLSHPDNNEKYLVQQVSGISMENEPQSCITVPEASRAAFAELLADRLQISREHYRLERAFKIPKPFDIVTEDQANQFRALRFTPGHSTSEVELFRGAVDLITLGNVYFDRKRTLAAVYTWAYCGGLCGYGTWRVFSRNGKGDWEEQHWITCMTVATARRTPQNVIAPMHIADAAQ
jgi:hypothetical protein